MQCFFITWIKSDKEGTEHHENSISSVQPSKWFKKVEDLCEEQITILWWIEISEKEAEEFDPGYRTYPGGEYYGKQF